MPVQPDGSGSGSVIIPLAGPGKPDRLACAEISNSGLLQAAVAGECQ